MYDGDRNGNRTVDDEEVQVTELEGDGDFRSEECVELLKQADIVVTNPPFSLFREYVAQLVGYGKKFLIIGSPSAVKYREIFPLIKNGVCWLGATSSAGNHWYGVPEDYDGKFTKIENGKTIAPVKSCWFTNLDHKKRHEFLTLTEKYDQAKNPKFDSYDAVDVKKTVNIPKDYFGVMGVPITFLDKYNPEQFEIVGMLNAGNNPGYDFEKPVLNGRVIFTRLLIRRKPVGENAETPAA